MEKLFLRFKTRALLVITLCFVLYSNTFKNTYALDDEIIILENLNVQQGFSGIKKILSTDAFQGYLDKIGLESPLTGGRYRPLSIVTFAIEQGLAGETYGKEYIKEQKELAALTSQGSYELIAQQEKKLKEIEKNIKKSALQLAPFRHIVQVILFALSMVVLLFFLEQHIFTSNLYAGFLTVTLFILHPVHTEVIANIKSRDEIISLLFILLTLIYCFRYHENRTNKNLLLTIVFSLAALLSKEYALVLPVIASVGLISLKKYSYKKLWSPCIKGMLLLTIVFAIIRFGAFNTKNKITDVLNDPYMYATPAEALASKFSLVIEYIRLLVYPSQLSSDYSYNHFHYTSFGDMKVWLSIFIYVSFVALFIWLMKRKHELAFPLAIFLGFFIMVNNLVFDIGATMGERLIYHSSLGFCIIIIWLLAFLFRKINSNILTKQILAGIIVIALGLPLAAKTISRNTAWKSNYTLFTTDVKTIPESALTNGNAGTEIFNKALEEIQAIEQPSPNDFKVFAKKIDPAIIYFNKAISIHPKYITSYMNRGQCYFYQGKLQLAAEDWKKATQLLVFPNEFLKQKARLFFNDGLNYGSAKNYQLAIAPLLTAAEINPFDAETWNNLGGAYFMTGKFKDAVFAFGKSIDLNPTLDNSMQGKKAAEHITGLQEKLANDSTSSKLWVETGDAIKGCGLFDIAEEHYRKALALEPQNQIVQQKLKEIISIQSQLNEQKK